MAPVLAPAPSSSTSSIIDPSSSGPLRQSSTIKAYPDQLRSLPTPTLPPPEDPTEVARLDSLRHATARLDARHYKHPSFTLDLLEILRRLHVPHWSQDTLYTPQDVIIRKVSGALTNAVFFVSCPSVPSLRTLLLRVYGPSSGSLISRPRELRILHVLSSRYKIGPRVYGTFENGRIEEYFHSVTLTPSDIRNPEISRWIGARMAELHSVDITTVEGPDWRRRLAPYGFQIAANVKSWLDPAEDVLKLSCISEKTRQAFDLPRFEREWQRYIVWATSKNKNIGSRRVFGHNDAQYGNLLRLKKGNHTLAEHRQIIVVDFEYAAPNPAAYDIANHFHEWTANYHGPNPHLLDPSIYPTLEQRRNFYAAYIQHERANNSDDGPVLGEGNSSFTIPATHKSSSSLSLPLSAATAAATPEDDEGGMTDDALIEELEESVRVWSPASHAGWAIWGIVQARDDLEASAAAAAAASPATRLSLAPHPSTTPRQPPTGNGTLCNCNNQKGHTKATVAPEVPATTLPPSFSSQSNSTNPAGSNPRLAATTSTKPTLANTTNTRTATVAATTTTGCIAGNLRGLNHGGKGEEVTSSGADDVVVGSGAAVGGVVGVGVGVGGVAGPALSPSSTRGSSQPLAPSSSPGAMDASPGCMTCVGGAGSLDARCSPGQVDNDDNDDIDNSTRDRRVQEGPLPAGCCEETASADFDYIGYAYGRMVAFRRDLERLGI